MSHIVSPSCAECKIRDATVCRAVDGCAICQVVVVLVKPIWNGHDIGQHVFPCDADQDIVEHLSLHAFGRAFNEIVNDCVLLDWLVDVGADVHVVDKSSWRGI